MPSPLAAGSSCETVQGGGARTGSSCYGARTSSRGGARAPQTRVKEKLCWEFALDLVPARRSALYFPPTAREAGIGSRAGSDWMTSPTWSCAYTQHEQRAEDQASGPSAVERLGRALQKSERKTSPEAAKESTFEKSRLLWLHRDESAPSRPSSQRQEPSRRPSSASAAARRRSSATRPRCRSSGRRRSAARRGGRCGAA